MKKNFNFLIIIFFTLPFSGLSQKSYMIHDTLNGRIKSIKYKISINNNKIDSTFNKYICHLGLYGSFSEENIYIFDFDENGNNIFYNNDDFNNDIKYDNNHQMIEIKKYVTGANKEKYFKKKATCEYFNGKIKNRKSYEYYYDKELLQYEKNAVYDKNLNIIKDSVNFYKKGVFQHSNRIEYKFNEKNQMIECKNISRFGGVEIYKYSYEKKDKFIEIIYCFKNNEIDGKTLIEYDEINSEKKIKTYSKNKLIRYEVCKYDQKNQLINEKKINVIDEKIYLEKTYKYDNNKLVEFIFDEKNLSYYKKTFAYDSKENIIECKYFDIKNTFIKKEEFQIEYY